MTNFLKTFIKDPDETRRYSVDFWQDLSANRYLPTAIVSHEIVVPPEMSLVTSRIDVTEVAAYVAGGVEGGRYVVTFRLWLENPSGSGPNVALDRSIRVQVQTQ